MHRLDDIENLTYMIEKAKIETNKKKYESNDEFVDNMNLLISKTNCDVEDLFIHATSSLESSKSIMEKGLYTFGEDLGSFCFPYNSFEQIFKYQYGSEINRVGDYIVLFRLPKENYELEKISEEEGKEMIGNINMRRSAVIIQPTHKVKPEDIVGVIDKKNMKVIENHKFISGRYVKTASLN